MRPLMLSSFALAGCASAPPSAGALQCLGPLAVDASTDEAFLKDSRFQPEKTAR